MLPRIPEWYELLLGMFRFGVIPMPATTLCTPRDIAQRIERAGATIAVVDDEAAVKLAGVRDQCPSLRHVIVVGEPAEDGCERYGELMERASDGEPTGRVTSASDPLLLYFTSGTVAAPKMVLHTHASMGAGHEITARFWQDLTPADLHWTFSDTGWAKAAWGKLFGQWRMGAAVFLWDQRGKLDPELCLRVLERSGVTTFCAPPTLFRAFVQLDLGAFDLARVRHTVSAGEPLNPEVIRAWREATGTTIYDGYGQTETVNIVANFPCLEVRPGSMGKPTPGNDVDVVSDDGVRLGPGEEGNIALATEPERPVGLMQGYWRDDDANAEVFHDGWYFTGDRAVKDEDGYFWFVSRSDDVIISASYRIGPFEVESALVEHPAVAESAVVGKPDPGAHEHRQGVRRARARPRGLGRARARAAGARQDRHRAVQVPARDRVRELAAEDDLGQDPPQRAARALVTPLPPFAIERYFAVHEFAVPYLLCASDVEPLSLHELLAYADDETRDQWDGLVLGYTETLGAPPLRREIAGLYEHARGRRRDRRRGRERGALHPLLGARAPGRSRRRAVARLPVALRPRPRAGRRGRARRAAPGGRLGLDLDRIAAAMRPTTRAVVVNLPHNPTGMLPSAAELAALVELAERHGATLVCDEVYRGLEQDPADRLPAAADLSPRAVSVGVLSKTYALAGLRVGWLATRDRELLDAVAQVRDYTSLCSPAPSEVLGTIALRAADALVERSRAIIAANLPLVDALMAEHADQLDWVRPSAGSIGFPRYRGGEGIDAFNERLVAEQGVLLLPGRVYGYGDGRFRLGFGRRNLPEAVERLDRQLRA